MTPVERDPGHEASHEALGRAMADLMLASRTAAAFTICRVTNDAARHLGIVRVDLFLIDYSQRHLCSIDPDRDLADKPVEGTVAGRAYTSGRPLAAHHREGDAVWWPLVDGTERLGAARVVHDRRTGRLPEALVEPFIALTSEILVAKNQYSDWYRRCRRRHDLSLSAELQWRQLPPLTFTHRDFAIAGALEPAYQVGGDAFDYGHNPRGLHFTITDAMGHGVEAMLLSTAAMAALRHARAHDLSLEHAYRAADGLLAEQFGDSRFVTGVLGHLDPDSAVLTWVNAGHPLPLLVRDGHVTGTLSCTPSLPMGLSGTIAETARHALQPGDRVLFYTDGVTDTRHQENRFGLDRLADHLQRATLDGLGAAETLRRLSLAVLAHSDYRLTDDASLLLVEARPTETWP
jgi:hypothetical protein